jgi:fimbrial chaperone protein
MPFREAAPRVCAILALSIAAPAAGGTFRVTPVKVFFDQRARSASVTITNDGREPVTVQIEARRWTQSGGDGEDEYTPSDEILFFPRMATLPPGSERVIRIGVRARTDAREESYRLFIRELPVVTPGEVTVKLALNLGIPIFVKPAKELVEWGLEGASLSEERLEVHVRNRGNAHVVVERLVAIGTGDDGDVFSREVGGWYALAGGSRKFVIALPAQDCLKAKAIRIEALARSAPRVARLELARSMCTPAPTPPAEPRSPPG